MNEDQIYEIVMAGFTRGFPGHFHEYELFHIGRIYRLFDPSIRTSTVPRSSECLLVIEFNPDDSHVHFIANSVHFNSLAAVRRMHEIGLINLSSFVNS